MNLAHCRPDDRPVVPVTSTYRILVDVRPSTPPPPPRRRRRRELDPMTLVAGIIVATAGIGAHLIADGSPKVVVGLVVALVAWTRFCALSCRPRSTTTTRLVGTAAPGPKGRGDDGTATLTTTSHPSSLASPRATAPAPAVPLRPLSGSEGVR